MKKFLRIVLIIIIVIFLICLAQKLGILGFSSFNISEEKLSKYTEYYFKQLEQDEKEIYVRLDEAINNREKYVSLGLKDPVGMKEKVQKVITAYFYDNPQCYYISNEYYIYTRHLLFSKEYTLVLNYITRDDELIETQNKELEAVIDEILTKYITENMTDFEKELAIHDALVKYISYYEFEDVNEIPYIKHTAYGALVGKEAVCDGYTKAFKMLLDRVGIESIIVYGSADNVAHAWNIVELDGEYYHVDVTSDRVEYGTNNYVAHAYFNVADDIISKTHTMDKIFDYSSCTATEYDYYIQNGYYIDYEEYLDSKLQNIIAKQKKSDVLEIKVDERYKARRIVDVLYELDFNNWRSNSQTSVHYVTVGDVYLFIK